MGHAMTAHPLDAIFVTGSAVNKALVKAELKKYARDFVDATTFRTYDLPGVSIAVIAGQLFLYDAADLVTADNGATCILDASSRRFKRQSAAVAGSTIFTASSVSGTNTITCASNGMAAYSATVQFLYIKLANTISGAATIAIDALGTLDFKSPTGAALATGEAVAGVPMLLAITSTDARIVATGLTW